jgi:hypothetical protein
MEPVIRFSIKITSGSHEVTSAEAMSGNIDDVVRPRHDVHITIIINHASIARINPFAIKSFQVALVESHLIVEQGGKA